MSIYKYNPKTQQEYYRENDNVYFNVTISHPGASFNVNPDIAPSGTEPILAQYQIDNDTPFIDNASEYYASVIRFDIPLDRVPVFICPVIPNQANFLPPLIPPDLNNVTPFIIGVKRIIAGITTHFPQHIIYTGYFYNNLKPPQQNQSVQVITPYYYIYDYADFLTMVNNALILAWNNAGLLPTDIPYFFLDVNTGIIKFAISPQLLIPNPFDLISIYMNIPLSNYLGAFSVIDHGFNNAFGDDLDLILPVSTTIKPHEEYLPVGWGIVSQEYTTLPLWHSIRKIVILSAKLPIVNESSAVGIDGSTRVPILTDFVPILTTPGNGRDIAYYVPTGQYRLSDMVQTSPLQSFDLKVYWQDSSSNIFPLEISIFQQVNIKLAFFRKDLYKHFVKPV